MGRDPQKHMWQQFYGPGAIVVHLEMLLDKLHFPALPACLHKNLTVPIVLFLEKYELQIETDG